MLNINEIFFSIQGEGTKAGKPCIFIRLAGCNLNCVWCDTKYAINTDDSLQMSIKQILNEIKKYDCNFVMLTGGEPLMQPETVELTNELLENYKLVAIETNGSYAINVLPQKVIKILDVKCPASEMAQYNYFQNFSALTKNDEIKFVIASENDFHWSCEVIKNFNLFDITENILFSAVTNLISYKKLAELILQNKEQNFLNFVRMQIQYHKIIWDIDLRGV
jgi:7-carboxy-7-deazaguanine synthase